jgi:hypothetical protein
MMPVVDGIPSDGSWFRAEGGTAHQPTMIRARQDVLARLPAASLSTRIVVSWSCRAPLEMGLPSSDDYEEISAFEETLINFVQEGAILAFVFTSAGIVEYSFYTSDQEWFLDRLNEALADKPPVPIEISAEDDPDWTEYRSLMQAVGIDGAAT